jgi:universal stress protein F
MNLRRILVGLDGSPRESLVLAAAQDLALKFDAALLMVRAVGIPPELPPEAWQDPTLSVKEYLEKRAREGLERCEKELCEALRSRHSLEVVVATPWEALCLCAQTHQADMIVIGSHGYSGIDRILGTTAARVVNHALCSVFVVRAFKKL